jgi:curli production assembly/transport component CsgE
MKLFDKPGLRQLIVVMAGALLAVTSTGYTSPDSLGARTSDSTANQEPEPAEPEDAQDIEEISGLITERTMTKIGYEFYENFYTSWESLEDLPKEFKDYNISIIERANPTWGSWIQVKVDVKTTPTIVWSNIVRPRSTEVKESAENAVEATKNYLYRYEEYRAALESSDMAGNGIY